MSTQELTFQPPSAIRRLARQAVIFMLLSFVAGFLFFMVASYYEAAKLHNAENAELDFSDLGGKKISPVNPPVALDFSKAQPVPDPYGKYGGNIDYDALAEQAGATSSQPATNDWFAQNAPRFPTMTLAPMWQPFPLDYDFANNFLVALLVGCYGFVGGLALWLVYRLVYFAVKG
jgi:hypothetical protein